MSRLAGWLNRLRPKDPLSKLSAESWNRICTVLEELEGVGCRVQKNTSGKGWKIIVDGTSDVAAPGGGLFPWGSQWPWGLGIEVTAEDDIKLTVYNPCARVGRRFFPSIAGVAMLTTPDTPTPMVFEGAPLDDWWGVAVDVDWLGMEPEDPVPAIDLKVFGEAADVDGMFATPDAPHAEWDRIPIAVFEGTTLRRYYGPGVYAPALWVP